MVLSANRACGFCGFLGQRSVPYHQLVLIRTSHTCCSSSMALTLDHQGMNVEDPNVYKHSTIRE